MESDSYLWTDREERHYVRARRHEHHWFVDWGDRLPAGSDVYSQHAKQEGSSAEEAIATFRAQVGALSGDWAEADRAVAKIKEALAP